MKVYLLMVLVLFSVNVYSEDNQFSLKLDHATIIVDSVEASSKFYKEILMLKEVEHPWGDDPSVIFLSMGGIQQLHIAEGSTKDIKLNKTLHLAFRVKEFESYLKFLKLKNIKYGDFSGELGVFQTRPDKVRQVYFQDPDGYWIEVNDAGHTTQ